MRICIVGHEYPPFVISGPGRYASNLVRELESKGHDVTMITPRAAGGKRHEKGGMVEIYRLGIPQSGLLEKILPNILDVKMLFSMALRNFFREFDVSGYDILHILDMHDSYFLNREISEKIPVVISVNDYYSFEISWNILKFPYFCSDLPFRHAYWMIAKVLNKKYLKFAHRIISDTKYSARAVNKATGIPLERIHVIYKGVDADKFRSLERGKYHNHKMLYVGSNMERKGMKDIVRAMPKIVERFPDAKLTAIGKASILFKKHLRKLIRKNGMEGNIDWIEHIASDRIDKYYKEANVFVFAPVIEDLAQVLLEAMATETPVVCTGVGANPEGILDGETGFLVEPGKPDQISDAVIKLFENPGLARRMGKNGRERVEMIFNSGRMLRETLNIYEKTIKGVKNESVID